MKPEELIRAMQEADDLCEKHGLPQPDGLSLVIVRPRPPTGYDKIRTPFGLCKIMNCQEIDGLYQTVFRANRKQIVAYLRKAIGNETHPHNRVSKEEGTG